MTEEEIQSLEPESERARRLLVADDLSGKAVQAAWIACAGLADQRPDFRYVYPTITFECGGTLTTGPDIYPILPSVTTVMNVLINPDDVLPHRRPELVNALRELCTHHRLYRSATADLATEGLSPMALSEAAETASEATAEIDYCVSVIDVEVSRRLTAMAVVPDARAPRHSESVGTVLSRVVALWIEVDDHREGTAHLPAATQLAELLDAYVDLSAELILGERQLPTPRRALSSRPEPDGAW